MDLSGPISTFPVRPPLGAAAAVLPPPLAPGDRVGVAALSGPVRPERLAAGLAALAELGYVPVEASNLDACHGLFAGDDASRLAAFHELAADPDVKAIFFARGGHGVLRLLPAIDWELLARHPRAYVGYSDLTAFLLQVVDRLGLVAFHGPMVAADLARGLTEDERHGLGKALRGELPLDYVVESEGGPVVEGTFVGGCLSLLNDTLGTPWASALDGALLFVEEIDEPLYRLDRMLTHLRLSGRLESLQGMVSGHLLRVGGAGETERHGSTRSRELFREHAEAMGVTYAWGLEAGHTSPNLTLPLGTWAKLDPTKGHLVLGAGSQKAQSH